MVPKSQPKITEISALEVYYFKVNIKRESMFFLQEDRLSFVLTLKFKLTGQKSFKFLVGILGETMTS